MDLKKGQKGGRDDRTKEDYPTSAVYFCRCGVIFLCSFISALLLGYFQLHSLTKMKFNKNIYS